MNHKNVLKLHQIRENQQYIFLIMDLMEGRTLKDLIIQRYIENKFFTDLECSLIIKGILDGLNYLEKKGISHRDIKPDNIMFRYKNDFSSVTIGDFGLSTVNDYDSENKEGGTPIFMAPEQIIKKAESSDIWAVGIIVFILSSGGSHPIYRVGMSYDKYITQLKNRVNFEFNNGFPM